MINVSKAFRRALYNDKRKYEFEVKLTLKDSTVINLDNTKLWNGGVSFEEAVGSDNKFDALGSAIAGSAHFTFDNTDESYSGYDFLDADVFVRMKLYLEETSAYEVLKMGYYTVDDATYNGTTITLSCLDYMAQFDRPYTSALSYPASLATIVQGACTDCGVTYLSATFPHSDYIVQSKPEGDRTTYRDIISYAAQVAGCYAKFNKDGKLFFGWFDDAVLDAAQEGLDGGIFDSANPYATGDTADGGTFNPWNLGAEVAGDEFTANIAAHYVSDLFNETIGQDDVVITQVQVINEEEITQGDTKTKADVTYTAGEPGYAVVIERNPFITAETAQTVCNWLGLKLIGLTFRKCNVSHATDPSIEAGDVALLYDHKQREYPILVTRVVFTPYGKQQVICGAETPSRNKSTSYSNSTRNYVDLRRKLKEAENAWDLAEKELQRQLANSSGLYTTKVEDPVGSGAYKTYYHDKPELEDSDIVMQFTDYGFTLTSDYQNGNDATWYGIGADGKGILDVLQAKGIVADWVRTGTLADKNQNTKFNLATGALDMKKGSVQLGALTGGGYNFSVNDSGQVTIKSGSITLGDKSDTTDASKYYFDVNTSGNLSWNSQYSSMSANGRLNIKDGTFKAFGNSYVAGWKEYVLVRSATIEIGIYHPDTDTYKITGQIHPNMYNGQTQRAERMDVHSINNLSLGANGARTVVYADEVIGFCDADHEIYPSQWWGYIDSTGFHNGGYS